jgi:hypothetical protein
MLLKNMIVFVFLSLSYKVFAFDWIAYGDLRGHIEPCGCDPQTDLGGVLRLSNFVRRERVNYLNLLVLDLGNSFSSVKNKKNLNFFIAKALANINPDVALYNFSELSNVSSDFSSRNFVLSNLKFANKDIKSVVIKDTVAVFGFLWKEKLSKKLLAFDKKLFQIKSIKEVSKKVLLFSGPDSILEKIDNSKIFDLIISSNTTSWDKDFSVAEKNDPQLLFRKEGIRMVPLGGAGVLRGGNLKNSKTLSIKEIFSAQNKTKKELSDVKSFFGVYDLTWLEKKYEQGSPLSDLIKEYRKKNSDEYQQTKKQRLLDLKESNYVGSDVCKSCHLKEYSTWKMSRHADAFSTLEKKSQDQNTECISCHVLGWDKRGGFVGVKETPHMKGVNCENCHGPRKDHITNPKVHNKNKKTTSCTSCHNTSHSPSFENKSYWKKIEH